MIEKITANIGYNDYKLNLWVDKGTDIIDLYKENNVELDDERIALLEKGNDSSNHQPFITVTRKPEKPIKIEKEEKIETADLKKDKVETATVKTKRVSKNTNK